MGGTSMWERGAKLTIRHIRSAQRVPPFTLGHRRSAPGALTTASEFQRATAPPSGAFANSSLAPSTSACPTAMVSPSPCPRAPPSVRNRCGPCATRYSGNPSPWSRTVTTGPSTVSTTGPRPCLCAFATRLPSTRSSRRRSVSTATSRTTLTSVSRPRRPHRPLGQRPQSLGVQFQPLPPGVQPGDLQQVLGQRPQRRHPVPDQLRRPPRRKQFGRRVQPGQRCPQLVRDIRREPLLGSAASPAATPPWSPARRPPRPPRPAGRAGSLRAGIVDARVEVARTDPPGHPRGRVQPPRHPGHRERPHQQRRPDRQPRRPQDRPVEAVDRPGALRVVDLHGQRPVRRRPDPPPTSWGARGARRPSCRGPRRPPAPAATRAGPADPPRRPTSACPRPRTPRSPPSAGSTPGHGPADGLVRHRDVHEDAEQRGERAAHHGDEDGGLHGERAGPAGERESHRALADGEAGGIVSG